MSSVALTPRVMMMAVCDGVRQSIKEPGVFDLKGVRRQIVAPNVPFRPKRLFLFLVLSYPRAGEFSAYLRIISNRDHRTIYYTYLDEKPVFDQDGGEWMYGAPIRCWFPEYSLYTVELCFFQEAGYDVLKGETELSIVPDQE